MCSKELSQMTSKLSTAVAAKWQNRITASKKSVTGGHRCRQSFFHKGCPTYGECAACKTVWVHPVQSPWWEVRRTLKLKGVWLLHAYSPALYILIRHRKCHRGRQHCGEVMGVGGGAKDWPPHISLDEFVKIIQVTLAPAGWGWPLDPLASYTPVDGHCIHCWAC